jgi:hypothetical protein
MKKKNVSLVKRNAKKMKVARVVSQRSRRNSLETEAKWQVFLDKTARFKERDSSGLSPRICKQKSSSNLRELLHRFDAPLIICFPQDCPFHS